MLTLGSLFDGIGGWCLAAQVAGIKPVWSAEIEPFCCEVTKQRFPDVKQLGDVTKINGAEIEPVDIICAGSPCQDLSVAGRRVFIFCVLGIFPNFWISNDCFELRKTS